KHGKKPFKDLFYPIGDKVYSLDQIENENIRPLVKENKDARIHFALGCPILLNEVYTAEDINDQLDFVTNSAFLLDRVVKYVTPTEVQGFEIFNWYDVDFEADSPDGTVQGYVKKFIKADKVTFPKGTYNWKLNIYPRKLK
ncbi:DUF547 domain-containing protein, partial [Bacteriovoracaceae bacterium]|nr:DUF547 domain-containing protein [Bacteriovoracaceae bacterium]